MPSEFEWVWYLDDGQLAPDARPPVTSAQLTAFQHKYDLELPGSLVELYEIQNGGFSLRYETLYWPIEAGENDDMTTLQVLSDTYHQDVAVEEFWKELLGDLSRVVVFLGDGHFYGVLNYNQLIDEEPTVEIVAELSNQRIGLTFAQWLRTVGR